MTPRTALMTYGDEIEITDLVMFDGLPTIRRSIDSTDYEIGVYSYDDLTIKCANINGYFNDESDSRSVFTFKRDKAKFRVVFSNTAADTIVFRGLLNDEASKADADLDTVEFRILSRDSAIRTTKVSGGTISTGMTVQASMFAILNQPEITAVLGVDILNINPDLDFTIEDGSAFDDNPTNQALNQLLLASNSVMLIDSDDNVIIRDRAAGEDNPVLNLYGPFDIQSRQNIVGLTAYNPGKQRMFTSVKVNNTESTDEGFVTDYGYRQKKMTMDFVTSEALATTIGTRILDEFKVQKIECNVQVPTYIARGVDLLDRVSFNYPLRIRPIAGKFLPIIGSTVIGDTEMPLPNTFGSLSIDPNIQFKVIEVRENPKDFETILKLRQTGNTFGDGYFAQPASCILGFAKIGDGVICSGGTTCDAFEGAGIGGAKIGCTLVA